VNGHFSNVTFKDANADNGLFRQSFFSELCKFESSSFQNTSFEDTIFKGAQFIECNFEGYDLICEHKVFIITSLIQRVSNQKRQKKVVFCFNNANMYQKKLSIFQVQFEERVVDKLSHFEV
jgi:uncharacterized protein YjbI with pentapeptide repeats